MINFRSAKVESRFVNAPITASTRRAFQVERLNQTGSDHLVEFTIEMLRDLGTALSLSLYHEILVHLLGGEDSVIAMVPLTEGSASLGNPRFYLARPTESFQVTCFQDVYQQYEQHLRSLLRVSPLVATHWINIDVKCVTFKTVFR